MSRNVSNGPVLPAGGLEGGGFLREAAVALIAPVARLRPTVAATSSRRLRSVMGMLLSRSYWQERV